MSTLYVVATPIGNLEDITLRALRVLKEVDLVLCEDTRVTKKLLARYGIATPTESYHTHSRFSKIEKICSLLREGKNLALVSDAGTPAISDPGSHLVSLVREELGDGVNIIPVPGPSAVIAALSASGLPASEFLFLGFLPHKKGRETLFRDIASSKRTVVFYESTHRIMKTLASLEKYLGEERVVAIAKELTKVHERFLSGTPRTLLDFFEKNKDVLKGEFVVIVR